MTLPARRFRSFLTAAAVIAIAALQPIAAQTPAAGPPKSRLLQLTIVKVRPGMMKDYIAYQKSDVIPALQKGGVKWRDSWRTAAFGDLFQVAHVTEVTGLDQYDSPPPVQKALGEAGYAAYQEKVGGMTSSVQTYLIRTRPELSYMADETQPKMAILTSVDVMTEKTVDFESFLTNDWIPALKTGGGKYYVVSQVVYGGSPNEYMTLVGVENFADIGKGHPVTRALGEDGVVKLMTKVGAYAHRIERQVIRLDPDLSFAVTATSQAK